MTATNEQRIEELLALDPTRLTCTEVRYICNAYNVYLDCPANKPMAFKLND